MRPFEKSRFEPQFPCRHALIFRCVVHCDNELRYRTRIDWKTLDCFALSGRTGCIISLSHGGAALCPGYGVEAFQARRGEPSTLRYRHEKLAFYIIEARPKSQQPSGAKAQSRLCFFDLRIAGLHDKGCADGGLAAGLGDLIYHDVIALP